MGETLDPGGADGARLPDFVRVLDVPAVAPETGAETASPRASEANAHPGPSMPGLAERFGGVAPDAGFRPTPLPSSLGGAFVRAHAFVAAHEGGFQADPRDPGNWTGGGVGRGECRGTNWGISARAYPAVDIRALTREQAAALYRRDYWDRVRGDELPPPLALLVYDFAVLAGVSRAAKTLQRVLGVAQDGVIGPATLAAVGRYAGRGTDLCAAYLGARLVFLTGLPTWPTFGAGWAKRLMALPFQAVRMED